MRISDWSSDVCSSDLTLIVGPTGGGKTVIVNFLMAQAEKTGARQIFVDKDRGAQIFVLASGGTYLTLENGKPTGFAPLKALENKPEDRAWLSLWVRQLVRAESRPITVQEEKTEEHTSELQSLMRISSAVFCLTHKKADRLSRVETTGSARPRRYHATVRLR